MLNGRDHRQKTGARRRDEGEAFAAAVGIVAAVAAVVMADLMGSGLRGFAG